MRALSEVGQLQSADEATDWVHKKIAAMKTLVAVDAYLVEAGFREGLGTIELASATRPQESQPALACVDLPRGLRCRPHAGEYCAQTT